MSTVERFEVIIDTLNRKRKIRVYLPSFYNHSDRKFDVLYMHDGNNLFDVEDSYFGVIWDVKKALDEIEHKYNKSLIVVGIDNGGINRLAEYSPWVNNSVASMINTNEEMKYGGEGDLYVDWIVNSLIPYINSKYKTTNVNYIAGSSMGGLISLYAGFKYSNHFSKIGAMSPSIWFAKKELYDFIDSHFTPDLGVYLDVGGKELKEGEDRINNNASLLAEYLISNGMKNVKYKFEVYGKHNEKAWARRFPLFARWLLDVSK